MPARGHRASAPRKTVVSDTQPENRERSLSLRSRAETTHESNVSEDTMMGLASYAAQDPDNLSPSKQRSFRSHDASDQHNDGLIESFGHGLKRLMTVINKLEALGIDNSFSIPLPKIVVVGDQSAGKSSQIAALSEINVPRSGGTCTRCVLHISLRNNDEIDAGWRCTVSLLKKYDLFEDTQVDGPFSPWQLTLPPQVIPFMTLDDKNQLEAAMMRAQLALLNPRRNPSEYLRDPPPSRNQAEFSPNEVHLEIESPSLPNLTFYDLPGIINEDGNEQNSMPDLVRALAQEYMDQENTIIMLARAMESDPQTSSAGSLVHKLGAAHRTIGVLTKPDRLEPGANVKQWEDILSGRTFKADHGYFVTKQPSQRELDGRIDHDKARKDELDFFANQTPWNSKLKHHSAKFGTKKLSACLSLLLEKEIQTALPAITESIEIKTRDIEARLRDLPEAPPDNCLGLIYRFLQSLRTAVEKHMVGELPENAFVNECRDFAKELRENLVLSKPAVIVNTPVEQNWITGQVTIDVDSDDDTPMPDNPTANGSHKRQMAPPSTPSKRQRSLPSTPTPTRRAGKSARNGAHNYKLQCETDIKQLGHWKSKRFSLQHLRDTLSSMNTSGLPNQVDPRAEAYLIAESQEQWEQLIQEYVQKIEEQLRLKIGTILGKELSQWSETQLSAEAFKIVGNFLSKIVDQYRKYTARAIKAELLKPTTTNDDIYNRYCEQELAVIKSARFKKRSLTYAKFREEKYGDKLVDKNGNASKVTAEQLGEDPFELQIQVMARVRAYYLIAADYMADHMAKATNHELFYRCRLELVDDLQKALNISSAEASDNAKRLLAENPQREEERARLRNQREQLKEAQDSLASLHIRQEESYA